MGWPKEEYLKETMTSSEVGTLRCGVHELCEVHEQHGLYVLLVLGVLHELYVLHVLHILLHAKKCETRCLGALWAPTSSWQPFGPA